MTDREKHLKTLEDFYKRHYEYDCGDYSGIGDDVAQAIKYAIESIKTNENPVIHAKWIHYSKAYYDNYICNHCSFSQPDFPRRYCPNCGAKMDLQDIKYESGIVYSKANVVFILKDIQAKAENIQPTIYNCASFKAGIMAYDKLVQERIDKLDDK